MKCLLFGTSFAISHKYVHAKCGCCRVRPKRSSRRCSWASSCCLAQYVRRSCGYLSSWSSAAMTIHHSWAPPWAPLISFAQSWTAALNSDCLVTVQFWLIAWGRICYCVTVFDIIISCNDPVQERNRACVERRFTRAVIDGPVLNDHQSALLVMFMVERAERISSCPDDTEEKIIARLEQEVHGASALPAAAGTTSCVLRLLYIVLNVLHCLSLAGSAMFASFDCFVMLTDTVN